MSIKTWMAKGSMALNMMNGNQTQHRVPMNPHPRLGLLGNGEVIRDDYFVWDSPQAVCPITDKGMYRIIRQAPYLPGDVVWVREPGKVIDVKDYAEDGMDLVIEYKADGKGANIAVPTRLSDMWELKYKDRWPVPNWVSEHQGIPNGIFKEAARTFLKITGVRIERIQDISEEDAFAEGIRPLQDGCYRPVYPAFLFGPDRPSSSHCEQTAVKSFKTLWDSIYAGSWEKNSWVWVYEFERTDMPDGWLTQN
ncbi:MAG: hypothetical protein JEY79_14165 [Pseudodesulfovibrio sp.]|nr:hypothetical protein [Pseudodesulfovibrio sp.]